MKRRTKFKYLRLLRERFMIERWRAVVRMPDGQEEEIYSKLPKQKLDFTADPFLYRHRGNLYCFYETFDSNEKGVIACSRLDGDQWVPLGVVLEEPYHLSYPHIVEDNGAIYMIPESNAAQGIFLYKAEESSFPYTWMQETCLIAGGRYADSTLIKKDANYYIFTCRHLHPTHLYPQQLELWMSPALVGPWSLHPRGKCVTLPPVTRRISRPGGECFYESGQLYRVAQDCAFRYGRKLFKIPILELSPIHYKEGLPQLLMVPLSGEDGRHTWNRDDTGRYLAYDKAIFLRKSIWTCLDVILSVLMRRIRKYF